MAHRFGGIRWERRRAHPDFAKFPELDTPIADRSLVGTIQTVIMDGSPPLRLHPLCRIRKVASMTRHFIVLAVAVSFSASVPFADAADNQLTDQEKKDGWQLLFNGENYDGWICSNGKEVASEIVDRSMQPYKSGGYLIMNKKQFGDFIFKCDVKMPEKCNSGIFLPRRGSEEPGPHRLRDSSRHRQGHKLPRLRRDLRLGSPDEERDQRSGRSGIQLRSSARVR